MFPDPVPYKQEAESTENSCSEHAPQQVAPRPEQLDSKILRHQCQCVLRIANCAVKCAPNPAVHLLLRRCQSLRQARFDDGTDDDTELLPRLRYEQQPSWQKARETTDLVGNRDAITHQARD